MAFGAYVATAEEAFLEIENIILAIEAGDLRVAMVQEQELRAIFTTLQRNVEYRDIAGISRVAVSSPATRSARRRAFSALDRWLATTNTAFRASASRFRDFIQGRAVLGEMRQLQNLAVKDWKRITARLKRPDQFTASQVSQATQLAADTERLKAKFGGFNNWLEDVTGQASYGKAENMIALTNQAHRDAQRAISGFTRGTDARPGTLGAREALESDIVEQRGSIQFDRRRLVLSSTAHARGVYNATMIALAAATGAMHFMYYLTPPNRRGIGGTTRDELYQIRAGEPDNGMIGLHNLATNAGQVLEITPEAALAEARRRGKLAGIQSTSETKSRLTKMMLEQEPVATWPERYRRQNETRRMSIAFGTDVGIHPGSQELYLPIPTSLLHEGRAWAASKRARLRRAA